MTPPPTLTDLIATVQRDAPSDDPLDLLATASRTVTELSTVGDAVLDHYVAGARRAGRSWSDISGVLGVSKQAAHKRYSPAAQTPPGVDAGAGVWGFGRYTPRAQRTLAASVEAARALGHPYVGTEHLLLGQFTEPEAIAARVLEGRGVTEQAVREWLQRHIPAADPIAGDMNPAFTPRASEALGAAVREALDLGHNYIGTEHLLLALFADADGMAARALADLGLDAAAARDDALGLLGTIISRRLTGRDGD